MPQSPIRLSPHDLAHFRDEWCERCWYLAKRYNIKPPGMPFPEVTRVADAQMKKGFAGQDLSWLGIDGVAQGMEKTWVQSRPFDIGDGVMVEIGGMYDDIARDDGVVDVIDFKMTTPKPITAQRYEPQLNAYAYALENPLDGEPVKVRGLWLICWAPGDMSISPDLAHPQMFMGGITAIQVKKKPKLTEELMIKHGRLIAGGLPAPSADCELCGYMSRAARKVQEIKAEEAETRRRKA